MPALTVTSSVCKCIFLGRRACAIAAPDFYKLSLFRREKGRFECRLKDQDASMADMEVHEHVIVERKNCKAETCPASSQRRIALALHSEARRILQLGSESVA